SQKQTPKERAEGAKLLFEQTTRIYHLPSAEAVGLEKVQLQDKAAQGYRKLLSKYPEQALYASQAERSLGNIYAAQGKISDAVLHYTAVEQKFPRQEWEVLMALKSAADLLWDNGQKVDASKFYQQIIARFDNADATAVMKATIRGSKARLAARS
ncbi:MAG TPA: hypothetical protein VMZ27_00530, partial [Candidatus Saccharimonadales bacterium]|nr:hypothetical protein [Candidatus Saccharimonadales bacterium]